MASSTLFTLAADVVLAVHAAFVAFVVLGLGLIFLGKLKGWSWVRNRSFRVCHLAAIGIVVVQSWLGVICPLTTLEMALRERGGGVAYDGSFIAHWLDRWLYYQAPPWVFMVAYTMFGAVVVLSWLWVRPRRRAVSAGGG